MFGSIMRRWRLAAPLALAALASIMVAAGTLPSASASAAKSLHFRYSGDAADFINYTVNPAYFDCFSGYLDPAGGSSIKSGLRDCIVPGFAYNHVLVGATVGAWSVTASHNSTKGQADASMELAGYAKSAPASLNNDTVSIAFCSDEFCSGKDNQSKVLVSSRDILEQSEAKCVKNGSLGKANARSQANFLDLYVRHSGGNSFDTVASAEGYGSVVITRTFHFGYPFFSTLVLIVTTNDHVVYQHRNQAAISANGLRVIVQDGEGDLLADVVAAHTHADIECSTQSFHFDDPIGA